MLKMLVACTILAAASPAAAGGATVTLALSNMTCAACPVTVRTAIRRVPGVTDVTVDFEKKLAVVAFDDTVATVDQIATATRNAGFPTIRKD